MKPSRVPLRLLSIATFLFALSQAASSAVIYDEAISGDLSNTPLSPTLLILSAGENVVRGTAGGTGYDAATYLAEDPDIFTITIPVGKVLTAIDLTRIEAVDGSLGALGFFTAISVGSTIRTDLAPGSGALLSNAFVQGPVNLLADFANGSSVGGLPAFSIPLSAGTYTLWFQEISARVNYEVSFTTVPVPEPGVLACCAPLFAATLFRRRR